MGIEYNRILEVLYDNLLPIVSVITGLLLVLAGVAIRSSGRLIEFRFSYKRRRVELRNRGIYRILDRISSIPPFSLIAKSIRKELLLGISDEPTCIVISGAISIAVVVLGTILVLLLKDMGQLWYVKLLLCIMGLLIPYYIVTLLFDLYRYHVGRQIPRMIDEFRSAFIKHKKVRPALKECSMYIGRGLARIIAGTADSTFLEERLKLLAGRFSNVWFNIFVTLLLNYKENGGELIDQLYRLNRTMTRYSGIEKKKNKRLIWYEVFTVCASVVSIPAIFWLNNTILGGDNGMVIDAGTNRMIARVMGYSMLSLIVIRILRRM